jgi:2-keto-4-pentenoate hydratase/2-oxohepta-3-ene-1,7-dioic acid hydratase in catechol pathway
MKLVTFEIIKEPGKPQIGALVENQTRVVRLAMAATALAIDDADALCDMIGLLARGQEGLALVRDIVRGSASVASAMLSVDQIRLLSPVPVPNSIRDCMEFERHVVQCMQTVVKSKFKPLYWLDQWSRRVTRRGLLRAPKVWRQRPIYYKGNRRSVIGTEQDVVWPSYARRLDFELEFGVFVGRGGRDIDAAVANDHIAGYALFNDFSARDVQLREMQGRLGPAKGKDFDTGNVIGPWLTTADEIDERELEVEVRVNGETWSRTATREMRYTFAELIAYISRDETLYPGDFIASGTVPGGCGLELDRWIQPGDTVELRGGPLGTLQNRVVAPR